jgi:nicotinate-nucleotide adenylyltransferase
MRLAIFGGTFDPIHESHMTVARAAADRFSLERVLFVPAARPPHKAGATQAPYDARVRMAELACAGEPRFEVSRLEEGAQRSYSIITIEKVRAQIGAADDLFFLIGADAFAEIRSWRRWREVARAVEFLVVGRPGYVYEVPEGVRLQRLDTLALGGSSSAIRAALADGRRPAGVPPQVLDYIFEEGLYQVLPASAVPSPAPHRKCG